MSEGEVRAVGYEEPTAGLPRNSDCRFLRMLSAGRRVAGRRERMDYTVSQGSEGAHIDWALDGVPARVIDWFWSNMERDFLLWHPEEHESLSGAPRQPDPCHP